MKTGNKKPQRKNISKEEKFKLMEKAVKNVNTKPINKATR
jgi:hypothetical protein